MRKFTFLIALATAASIWASAFAGWQSRDSNYNISISSGGSSPPVLDGTPQSGVSFYGTSQATGTLTTAVGSG